MLDGDMEHTSCLGLLSQAGVLNQVASILTLGQGLSPPQSILIWNLWGSPS